MSNSVERKLVTLRRISDLQPIPGADAIECATVDGWKLVVKRGEFEIGDTCVYLEIDSFLPENDPRFAFLMKSGVREFEGARGHKLRTIKLRGTLSQGLALPLGTLKNTLFPEIWQYLHDHNEDNPSPYTADFSELLRIKKWEAAIPAELAGQVKGMSPGFIRKTDQERCQNLTTEIFTDNANAYYEVTTKLDGTSVTFYVRDGEVGVCSRNLELKINDLNAGNSLVRMLIDSGLQDALVKLDGPIAIQGELIGEGIQGNKEKIKGHQFHIFDMQNLSTGQYLTPQERKVLCDKLFNLGVDVKKIFHVPIIAHNAHLYDTLGISNMSQLLKFADGPSLNSEKREGLVFKRVDGKFSFKVISNAWLIVND